MDSRIAISGTICEFKNNSIGVVSIVARQNGTRPTVVYSTADLLTSINIGIDEKDYEDQAEEVGEDVIETISGVRQISISFNFFRDNAFSRASDLKISMRSNQALEYLNSNGLGYIRCSNIRTLTDVIDGFYEERAQMDMDFYISDSKTFIVNTIRTATIGATIEVSGRQDNFNINVD